MDGLAEKKLTVWQKRIGKLKSTETEHGQHSPFPPYFVNFVCFDLLSLSDFSRFCLISAIYLPIVFSFLPVFESSLSNFCPILRLAEQCDTKEWYISLAEQN